MHINKILCYQNTTYIRISLTTCNNRKDKQKTRVKLTVVPLKQYSQHQNYFSDKKKISSNILLNIGCSTAAAQYLFCSLTIYC